MSRFGTDPLAFFEAVYQQAAPWEIGEAQPAMVALLDEYAPQAPVLDVGCGSGDLAIHLARRGLAVLGVDFVEAAVVRANAKKASLPPEVAQRLEFRVSDALRPSLLGRVFGSVVDSGFFHLFDRGQCDRYADELAQVLLPKGRLYLHEFAEEFPIPNVPRQVTEAELRERFTAAQGWRLLTTRAAEFSSRVAPPVPAILACVERVG